MTRQKWYIVQPNNLKELTFAPFLRIISSFFYFNKLLTAYVKSRKKGFMQCIKRRISHSVISPLNAGRPNLLDDMFFHKTLYFNRTLSIERLLEVIMSNKKWRIILVSTLVFAIVVLGVYMLIVQNSKGNSKNGELVTSTFEVDGVNTVTEEGNIKFTTDDWSSFQFAINNKVYTWPVTYSELAADGYVIEEDKEVDYDNPDEFISRFHTMYHKDNSDIWFSANFKKGTPGEQGASDYYVECLSVFATITELQGGFILCNGVKTGMNYDEVVALMGSEVDKEFYDGGSGDRFDVRYENEDGTRMLKMTFEDDELETIYLYDNLNSR